MGIEMMTITILRGEYVTIALVGIVDPTLGTLDGRGQVQVWYLEKVDNYSCYHIRVS